MMRWLVVLILLAVCPLCVSQAISIDLTHAQNGRYLPHYAVGAANGDPNARTLQQIAKVNQRLADGGDTKAAFELGLAYLQGYGVAQDLTKAEHWFQIGATDDREKDIVAGLSGWRLLLAESGQGGGMEWPTSRRTVRNGTRIPDD